MNHEPFIVCTDLAGTSSNRKEFNSSDSSFWFWFLNDSITDSFEFEESLY